MENYNFLLRWWSFIRALIALGPWIFLMAKGSAVEFPSRRLEEYVYKDHVECRLSIADFLMQAADGSIVGEDYRTCIELTGGEEISGIVYYIRDLPTEFLKEHEEIIEKGLLHAYLHQVAVVKTYDNFLMFLPGTSNIEIYEPADERKLELAEYPSSVAWVIVTMGSFPYLYDREEFEGLVLDSPNIASQLNAMTFGRINMQTSIYEVFVENDADQYTGGSSTSNDVEAAIRAQLNVRSAADLASRVFYCIPVGTTRGWIAFTNRNHYRAIFNNVWCTVLSVLIHEFGHMLGLGHSSVNTRDQADESCYMSRAAGGTNSPAQTFNAHKSWQLGLYPDGHMFVDPVQDGPTLIRLACMADYNLITPGEEVVTAAVGDEHGYFLTYNRRKGFNSQSRHVPDLVTVSQAFTDTNSHRLAALDVGDGYTIETFGDAGTAVEIEICEHMPGDSVNPEMMLVSVVMRGLGSACLTEVPSMVPSKAPSIAPSSNPTRTGRPSPSPSVPPTQRPSIAPSSHPTVTAPPSISGNPSMSPTITAPPTQSRPPSQSPTQTTSPSLSPGVNTDDTFNTRDEGTNGLDETTSGAMRFAWGMTALCGLALTLCWG